MLNTKTHFLASDRGRAFGVCVALVLMVWFVFGQSIAFDFINCDDNIFVYENPVVLNGLTGGGVIQTLTQIGDTFYYPFTVLSFMLDAELYGMNPGGFHLTNVLLHSLSVLLLFFLLRRLGGSLWRSALVAAVFAIHPLQVEAVAWVTARKDVLSGLFFMLTLHAYVSYVRRPFSLLRYALVLVLFLAGLLSKPMLVTLPFILLLLDSWPLGRWGGGCELWNAECGMPKDGGVLFALSSRWKNVFRSSTCRPFDLRSCFLLLEKIPFFLLSTGMGLITFLSASSGAGVESVIEPDFWWRAGNAFVAYTTYLGQMVFPVGLAMPYSGGTLFPGKIAASLFVLAVISITVFLLRKKIPSLLFGWLWFAGMLFPVSGILRCLGGVHADRFVYLPHIGLTIAVMWLPWGRVAAGYRRLPVFVAMAAVLTGLMIGARTQAGYWRDGLSLWSRTLAKTDDNFLAHSNLGAILFADGDTAGAIEHFEKSLQIEPHRSEVWNNLAVAHADKARWEEAVRAARRSLFLAERQCSPEITDLIRSRLVEYQRNL